MITELIPHLFFRGFPKSCCTSTNHVVCHSILDKILNDGDIVNVDVTAFKNGWHGIQAKLLKLEKLRSKQKIN